MCLTGCDPREVSMLISFSSKVNLRESEAVLENLVGLLLGAFWMGTIISHMGSAGVLGVEGTGESSTSVELSHEEPVLGEYAGVDGSESMKVPKDLADIGGDIGDSGSLGRGDDGSPCPERR
jgi:hypothetical protein